MNEMIWLYLLTRLDGIICLAWMTLVIGGTCWGMYLMATYDQFLFMDEDREEKRARVWPLWKLFAGCVVILVLVPDQKQATFILAGTGVIEAAKSDTAKRIAGKSVDVVEKYLDEMLKEEKK